MPLMLRCVPETNHFHLCCLCSFPLRSSTIAIGYLATAISAYRCYSDWKRLVSNQREAAATPYNKEVLRVTDTNGWLMFDMAATATNAVLYFFLIVGIHCNVPVLMLPHLMLYFALVPTLTFLDTVFTISYDYTPANFMPKSVTCIILIALQVYLWITQYNCYRQMVEQKYCTCDLPLHKPSPVVTTTPAPAPPPSPPPQPPHWIQQEEERDVEGSLSAFLTLYTLSMMDNQNQHTETVAGTRDKETREYRQEEGF